jgi:hypothetical protein
MFVVLYGGLVPICGAPFNWIDIVMEEVREKVGRMVSEEAAQNQTLK